MAAACLPSPQQQQAPLGQPGPSPLSRYMMASSPQGVLYRPQMSPMNMMSKNRLNIDEIIVMETNTRLCR
jgi:hypothetical protein